MSARINYNRITGSNIQGDATTVTEPLGTLVVTNNGDLRLHDGTTAGGNPVGGGGGGGSSGWQLTSSTAVVSLTSDGNMTLPGGGTISDGKLNGMGTIRLEPSGASSSTQALVIYPTAGDGNHIHLTAGGGETDLYLGSDIQYVKVDHGGSIVIGAVGANTSTWTFSTNSNLTVPGTIVGNSGALDLNYDGSVVLSGIPSVDAVIQTTTSGSSNTSTWTFGTDGGLTLPLGGYITAPSAMGSNTVIQAPVSNRALLQNSDGTNLVAADDQGVAMTTVRGTVQFGYNLEAPGVPTHFHINKLDQSFDLFFGDDSNYFHLPAGGGSPVIGANDGSSGQKLWTFGQDGSLTFPNGAGFGLGDNGQLKVNDSTTLKLDIRDNGGRGFYTDNGGFSLRSNGTYTWTFGIDGTLNLPLSTNGKGVIQTTGDYYFSANGSIYNLGADGTLTVPGDIKSVADTGDVVIHANNGTQRTWTFGGDGSITFPDATVQTTAFTGPPTPPALASLLSTATTIAITAATAENGPSTAITVEITNHQLNHYGTTDYTENILSTGLVVIPDTTQSPPIDHSIMKPGTVQLTQTYNLGVGGSPAHSHYIAYAYVVTPFGTVWSAPTSGTLGNICLLAGTMISLADGSYKAIEDITYTDKMLSWNFDQGCYAETKAVWIKRGETGSQYNLLTFSDGTTLRTFDQHRIFNKQAGAFTYPMTDATPIGTITVNEHGQEITLVDKQVIVDTIEYYNVITDYHMNLFSDSILTSCRFNNIYPITDMKFVKDGRTLRTRDEFENIPDRFFYGLRLAEQTTDIETVEWYVNRLLSLEQSSESVVV